MGKHYVLTALLLCTCSLENEPTEAKLEAGRLSSVCAPCEATAPSTPSAAVPPSPCSSHATAAASEEQPQREYAVSSTKVVPPINLQDVAQPLDVWKLERKAAGSLSRTCMAEPGSGKPCSPGSPAVQLTDLDPSMDLAEAWIDVLPGTTPVLRRSDVAGWYRTSLKQPLVGTPARHWAAARNFSTLHHPDDTKQRTCCITAS